MSNKALKTLSSAATIVVFLTVLHLIFKGAFMPLNTVNIILLVLLGLAFTVDIAVMIIQWREK